MRYRILHIWPCKIVHGGPLLTPVDDSTRTKSSKAVGLLRTNESGVDRTLPLANAVQMTLVRSVRLKEHLAQIEVEIATGNDY